MKPERGGSTTWGRVEAPQKKCYTKLRNCVRTRALESWERHNAPCEKPVAGAAGFKIPLQRISAVKNNNLEAASFTAAVFENLEALARLREVDGFLVGGALVS